MGYLKIKKASGYDLLPADNVRLVKLGDADPVPMKVTWVGDSATGTISGAGDFVQADVDKIIAGINIINGASGPGIFPEDLSQVATSIT